jgi:hypothetical protein
LHVDKKPGEKVNKRLNMHQFPAAPARADSRGNV